MDLSGLGRMLLVFAVVLAVVGGLLLLTGRGVLPRIPGNLTVGRGNVRVFVPLGLCVVLSLVLTLVLNMFFRR